MAIEPLSELSERQVEELTALYHAEWWTAKRDREDIGRMLAESDEVVAFADDGHLVAFARVLTDYIYKAFVFDVIVAEPYRGRGLGTEVMEAIIEHPKLGGVEHVELYCVPEMVPFYRHWDFDNDIGELRLLRRER